MFNLAFAQHQVYRRKTRRFFVINDLYALRRIAIGTTDWVKEVEARAEASPYVSLRRGSFIEASLGTDKSDAWRLDAYLKRFHLFARTAWAANQDLRHSHDPFYDVPNLVARAMRTPL